MSCVENISKMKTTQNEEAKEAGRPANRQTDGRTKMETLKKNCLRMFRF